MTSMVNAFDILQDRIMRSRLAGDPPDALVQVRVGKSACSSSTAPTN